MAGAAIAIEGMSAATKVLTVKKRVFAANEKLFVRRQRLVYSAGPRGMDALADDETLGGAGVARDGSAELDVLVADLTEAEARELGREVFFDAFKGSCLVAFFGFDHMMERVFYCTVASLSRTCVLFTASMHPVA